MRYKLLLLMLIIVVSSGAGPFKHRAMPQEGQLFPGVTGPGPGVIAPGAPFPEANGMNGEGGIFGIQPDAQIYFQGSSGMNICWDVSAVGQFDSVPLICPGIQNFEMGKAYRLKISNITNRPDMVLYPTLEINSMTPRTRSYLEHNSIPVSFSENDFDQVKQGHFVTKVIFLPAPEFQNLAVSGGVDTIVNTQLPSGADPVIEAQNRGAVLAVLRMGNKDLGLQSGNPANFGGTPAMGQGRIPQIPISGVNIQAYGTPNTTTPYGIPGPPVLPPANRGLTGPRVTEPVNTMPSTEVPQVQPKWSGNQF
ncbi:MAG: hypothetical protein Q4G69_07655 [Planctomycetia bacterium]|nr:hypothetical protein [Planctomycetia bacterium]